MKQRKPSLSGKGKGKGKGRPSREKKKKKKMGSGKRCTSLFFLAVEEWWGVH